MKNSELLKNLRDVFWNWQVSENPDCFYFVRDVYEMQAYEVQADNPFGGMVGPRRFRFEQRIPFNEASAASEKGILNVLREKMESEVERYLEKFRNGSGSTVERAETAQQTKFAGQIRTERSAVERKY